MVCAIRVADSSTRFYCGIVLQGQRENNFFVVVKVEGGKSSFIKPECLKAMLWSQLKKMTKMGVCLSLTAYGSAVLVLWLLNDLWQVERAL